MSNIVTINGVQSARITFKDRPVCTTQQLAQFYGTDEIRIQQNHARNADRFEDGKHFRKVTGADLENLRLSLGESQISPMARSLILWTELGAARHAKMLETEQAWDVFEEMESAYFEIKNNSLALTTPKQRIPSRGQIAASILLLRSAAEDLKFSPSSVLGGYQKLEAKLGMTGLLPAYAIDAPPSSAAGSSEATKSASWLLKKFGVSISPAAFNALLVKKGFLKEDQRPSSKGGIKKFKVCTNLEFGKNLSSPKNPRETQPHWYENKFAALLELVLPSKPKAA